MQMYSMISHKSAGDITVNSIHPGVVETEVGREVSGCWKCLACCLAPCGESLTAIRNHK